MNDDRNLDYLNRNIDPNGNIFDVTTTASSNFEDVVIL
jgi:hypothetical protein